MHRFIVYQYGKVGSTAVVSAINSVPGLEAHQTHFLGSEAFVSIMDRLTTPATSDVQFEHASGQLLNNLRIYRLFMRRELSEERLTVVTMSREPFSWFRSALLQEVEAHVPRFQRLVHAALKRNMAPDECVEQGCRLVLERLATAVRLAGGIDELTVERRSLLSQEMEFHDERDFHDFLFFLGRFLMPHLWFEGQFKEVMQTGLDRFGAIGPGLYKDSHAWGDIYLLRFEELDVAFAMMLEDLGISPVTLLLENPSDDKPFSAPLRCAFAGEEGDRLRTLCSSRASRLLGYA